MRTILFAMFMAAGMGLSASAVSAAPASPSPIGEAATTMSGVQQVWYDRWGRWHPGPRWGGPRWGGPRWGGPACVRRCNPYRCWTVCR
jgi:hypothetical protein